MEATVNGIAAPPSPNGPLTVGLAAPPAAAAAVQVVLVGAPQQQAPDGQAAGPSDDAMLMPRNLHHLTRHWIPPAARGGSAVEKLGAKDARSAENKIRWVLPISVPLDPISLLVPFFGEP